MRIHVLGCIRNASTPHIPMDPYATVSYFLTTHLHRNGHEVHYYGYKESEVECTKHWVSEDKTFLEKYFVTDYEENHWVENDEGNKLFTDIAIKNLSENYKDGEIILCMWSTQCTEVINGLSHQFNNLKVVDAHIGHRWPDMNTPYHVYASISNQHVCMGMHKEERDDYWHETAIYPMANSLKDFKCTEKKDDYHLFMGRTNITKGITIFLDIARHFPDENFILAGQGGLSQVNNTLPPNVKHVGLLNRKQRTEYLQKAKSVISPSYYAEPFGLTAIEANLSGTPIICTDHGGYTESVIEGVTGFRCSYFSDFVNAINSLDKIDAKECRKNGEKFTAENLINDWERYLKRINKDWYDLD